MPRAKKNIRRRGTAGPRVRKRPPDPRGTDDRILASAEKLFSRHGYDAVTNQQIAADAGLTIGALYHYFHGKDAVYAATIQRVFGARAELPPGIEDDAIPAETRLAKLATWFVTIATAEGHAGRLILRELLDPRSDTQAILHTTLFESAFEHFQILLRQLVPAAALDDALASLLALLFGFSNLKGVRQMTPNISARLSSPEEIGRHATALLLHGLQRRPLDSRREP